MDESQSPSHDWRAQLSGHAGDHKETLIAISDAFLEEVPMLIERIRKAAGSGDSRTLRTAAHTLKSCFRYVASDDDINAAAEVEKKADSPDQITQQQIDHLDQLAQKWCQRVGQLKAETAQSI
ncbi:Signal transduction histidine kinase, phosphotransfer (Hpt) region domain protein [Rhodopirellula maiorica SM1]|uniref:Signal transduction histidine kinase, phosphotransfer (Hpt) region domain protein n=1 Tax=Rhodopirellula maiorica SM1 TaxID=1265738 RepID=M5R7J6_9BACT|nr:Hpt domain-containing protein [Rhodopirellula maiorica]EMI15458.1 Signal transduction histidine kinase, phosphotransfer (Hpt) region domain protein [Rhodopirellula maiorica SM1]